MKDHIFDEKLVLLHKIRHWLFFQLLFFSSCSQEYNSWAFLDGSPINPTDGPAWRANKPNPDDKRHCGIIYKGQAEDWECFRKENFICKQGGNSCGPIGNLCTVMIGKCVH